MQNTPGLDGDVPAMDLEGNCRLFPWNTGKGIGFPVTCKSCVCAAFMSRDKGEDGRFCSTLQVNGESVYDEEWNGRPTSRLIIHKCCVNLCGSLWVFVDLCGSLWIFVDIASSLIYLLVGLIASGSDILPSQLILKEKLRLALVRSSSVYVQSFLTYPSPSIITKERQTRVWTKKHSKSNTCVLCFRDRLTTVLIHRIYACAFGGLSGRSRCDYERTTVLLIEKPIWYQHGNKSALDLTR